jgi:hypothetical protein
MAKRKPQSEERDDDKTFAEPSLQNMPSTQVDNFAEEEKNKGGRPTKYSQDLANQICAELAIGKSMRTVLKADGMPAMSTVFKWLSTIPEFTEQYEKAKAESADALVEDMLYIAEEKPVLIDEKGVEKIDSAGVARNRLRVDTRKWVASKLKPKKYGEKTNVEVSGKDGGVIEVDHMNHALESLLTTLEKKLG